MWDILDPIRLPRISTHSPEEIPTEPSDPDFINLDNTNGSDDPESTTPPANSPTGMTTQPEIGRVSVETSAPNPLTEFIHVYSDDESLEASQRTPMHVQEEKGPEKASSPELEVQTKEVPQKETQFEGGLKMKGPDEFKTRAVIQRTSPNQMSQKKDLCKRKSTIQLPTRK
jgi:hypothetical protein